jgi:hypothetical protein
MSGTLTVRSVSMRKRASRTKRWPLSGSEGPALAAG